MMELNFNSLSAQSVPKKKVCDLTSHIPDINIKPYLIFRIFISDFFLYISCTFSRVYYLNYFIF